MFDSYSQAEVINVVSQAGVAKGYSRLDKVFFSSVFAGSLLAFACGTLLSTNAAAWYQNNAPGLIRTVSALVFPYGLSMIIVTGADLCTSSFLFTTVAALHRKLPWWRMFLHWFVTFWGNLAGSLFMVAIIFGCKHFCIFPSLCIFTDSKRWRGLFRRSLQIRSDFLRRQEASHARFPDDFPSRDWLQLACQRGLLHGPAGP